MGGMGILVRSKVVCFACQPTRSAPALRDSAAEPPDFCRITPRKVVSPNRWNAIFDLMRSSPTLLSTW